MHYANEDDAIAAALRNDPDFDANALPCFDAEDFRLMFAIMEDVPPLDNPFSED